MSFNPFYSKSSGGSGGGTGQDGRGIVSITFTSSTGGTLPSIAGATDTYTIAYTDGTSSSFKIKNGENGNDGVDGITPIFRVTAEYIQVSTDNRISYQNLIALSELKGKDGTSGTDGNNGADGESLEFEWDGTRLGIKTSSEISFTYQDLKGEDGSNGVSITNATVNSDGHLILTLSDFETIDAGLVKGADGTSITILGDLANASELPISGQKSGDCYLIGGHLWVYTASTEITAINGFIDAGQIQGPSGADGKEIQLQTGETAIQWRYSGETVWNDLILLSALKGKDGINGVDGNGITSVAFVSSAGGETAGIANATDTYVITYTDGTTSTFTIKNGKNGIDGENGKSAYQSWIDLGNTGTESDFIESLKGTDGITPDMSNYLSKTNTTEYTPVSSYNPCTKKYVDDLVGNIQAILATLTTIEEV